jgi:hypothetical protein
VHYVKPPRLLLFSWQLFVYVEYVRRWGMANCFVWPSIPFAGSQLQAGGEGAGDETRGSY